MYIRLHRDRILCRLSASSGKSKISHAQYTANRSMELHRRGSSFLRQRTQPQPLSRACCAAAQYRGTAECDTRRERLRSVSCSTVRDKLASQQVCGSGSSSDRFCALVHCPPQQHPLLCEAKSRKPPSPICRKIQTPLAIMRLLYYCAWTSLSSC